jgi:hypothetical protein
MELVLGALNAKLAGLGLPEAHALESSTASFARSVIEHVRTAEPLHLSSDAAQGRAERRGETAAISQAASLVDRITDYKGEMVVIERRFSAAELASMGNERESVFQKFFDSAHAAVSNNERFAVLITMPDARTTSLVPLPLSRSDRYKRYQAGIQVLLVHEALGQEKAMALSGEDLKNSGARHLVITSEIPGTESEARIFWADRYGDNTLVSYRGDENHAVAGEMLTAALISLVEEQVAGLVYDSKGNIRAQSRIALGQLAELVSGLLVEREADLLRDSAV